MFERHSSKPSSAGRFFAAASIAIASPVLAGFVTLNLTPKVNSNIRTYTGGTFYPLGGQTRDFAGVPFALALLNGDANSFGVIQLPANNTLTTHSFSVNVFGATRVYTLINSAWGSFGANNGKVEVFGSAGAYAKFDLIQGTNIRDHYQGSFQNVLTDPTVVTSKFNNDVLDRQVLVLPAAFRSQSITEFRFSGNGGNPNGTGAAFLAGATFQNCPADLNNDGQVDDADFSIFVVAYNLLDCADPAMPAGCPADLNRDGVVDDADFSIFVVAYNDLICP
ncbi:MAG: hypothetical protein U0573_02920 [Phycisphaerales bacterium]|nr:hypothetical protein [Planctomycetota bacterium]